MIYHPPSFLESPGTALPTEQERVTIRIWVARCRERWRCTYPHRRDGAGWFIVTILEAQSFTHRGGGAESRSAYLFISTNSPDTV